MFPEPVVDVLFYSSLAALLTALGALPFAQRHHHRPRLVGLSNAAASGLMLGAAHLLMVTGLARGALLALLGAATGVAYTALSQWYAGTEDLEAAAVIRGDESDDLGYKLLLQRTLHSASEGIAIGIAMVVELRLGIFVALALAIHNVAEGVGLSEVLRERGMSLRQTAALCVVSKSTQPLFALATWALEPVLSHLLPGALGLAGGSLAFLVLTEVLPDSYEKTGRTAIASMATLTAGVVVLLEDFLL